MIHYNLKEIKSDEREAKSQASNARYLLVKNERIRWIVSSDIYEFGEMIESLLRDSWRNPENLIIGEDISDYPEIKVMFNSFGFDEDTQENNYKKVEEYCVFVHKNSGTKGFIFPEHETSPFGIIHRPDEEACIYAWYLVDEEEWEIEELNLDETDFTEDDLMAALTSFTKNYTV